MPLWALLFLVEFLRSHPLHIFIDFHSQDPSSSIQMMPRERRDLLQKEAQVATSRPFPHLLTWLRDFRPHPASQLHSHLLQLVDTLFHTADGGQCAQRLGVQTPETVLPADLEECYDATLLPRKRQCHMTSLCDLSLGLTQK